MKNMDFLIQNGVNVKNSLEIFGDIETYNDMIKEFLDEVFIKLDNIKKYKEIGDMTNYAILVHSLKSDAKYFGFELLAELAYNHELESKANNIYYVTENYDSLMREGSRIVNLAKEYLGESVVIETNKSKIVDKTKTILVVDDSNIIRNYVQSIFNDTFRVVIAVDGAEAIEKIDSNVIALLLDLNMPNVDGFAVLEHFKANNLFNRIPVFIITGENDADIILRAKNYPIIDILEKPFNERDIKEIVEKTISLQ